jgi:hypothetical protein
MSLLHITHFSCLADCSMPMPGRLLDAWPTARCQQTQLNMMGLGLSRTAAVTLSEYIADDNLSEAAVIDSLKELNLDAMNLPVALITEVKRLIALLVTKQSV